LRQDPPKAPVRKSLAAFYSDQLGTRIVRHRADVAMNAARVDAEQANLTKSEFIAKMSHELRTPLNAILGFSEILNNEKSADLKREQIAEFAKFIEGSAQHLLALINGILEISKFQSGMEKPDLVEIAFGDIVRKCFNEAQQSAASKNISVACEFGDGDYMVMADNVRLTRAIAQIVSNATKFCQPGGEIHMALGHHDGQTVWLSITDTGIGMTQEELNKAFELFWQADAGHDRQFEGTGLGLPIAQTLIELHGGKIALASQKDRGTEVVIELPCHRICQAPAQSNTSGADVPDGKTAAKRKSS
jgi:two-component system cell cycle sensor histidine kinase PleC